MINFVKFDPPVRIKEPNLVKSTEGFPYFFRKWYVKPSDITATESWRIGYLPFFKED